MFVDKEESQKLSGRQQHRRHKWSSNVRTEGRWCVFKSGCVVFRFVEPGVAGKRKECVVGGRVTNSDRVMKDSMAFEDYRIVSQHCEGFLTET